MQDYMVEVRGTKMNALSDDVTLVRTSKGEERLWVLLRGEEQWGRWPRRDGLDTYNSDESTSRLFFSSGDTVIAGTGWLDWNATYIAGSANSGAATRVAVEKGLARISNGGSWYSSVLSAFTWASLMEFEWDFIMWCPVPSQAIEDIGSIGVTVCRKSDNMGYYIVTEKAFPLTVEQEGDGEGDSTADDGRGLIYVSAKRGAGHSSSILRTSNSVIAAFTKNPDYNNFITDEPFGIVIGTNAERVRFRVSSTEGVYENAEIVYGQCQESYNFNVFRIPDGATTISGNTAEAELYCGDTGFAVICLKASMSYGTRYGEIEIEASIAD